MGRTRTNSKKIDFENDNINNQSDDPPLSMKKIQSRRPRSKSVTDPSEIKPKRRGRRPKKIFDDEESNEESDTNPQSDGKGEAAVILRLKLNPSKLNTIKMAENHNSKPEKEEEGKHVGMFTEENETEGMFANDIPVDMVCHKCTKYERTINTLKQKLEKYEKKDQVDKHTKLYHNNITFIDYKSGNKMVLKKTSIKCLWDGYSFTNIPFPLPEVYHNNAYHVNGCFCSIDCALAYNLHVLKDSKIYQRKSLAIKLYRELYDIPPIEDITIREAAPREILEDYGGHMSIEQFRKNFHLLSKEYITYIPPMKPLSTIIEEQNTNPDNNSNDKQYVLKRSKPLAKKRSIVSSMNLNIAEDDD
jgi:hypothetical protein